MEHQELEKKVVNILEQIRPYLQSDGGDVKFIELTSENVVNVELHGACHSCPMAIMTLKNGVEATIKKYIPEIVSVEAINLEKH